MAARDHLNAEQLRMFIPAKELISYNPNPHDMYEEHPGEFWESRADEAGESGLWNRIGEEGVKKPVNIWHGDSGGLYRNVDPDLPVIANGHHRTVSAADHDPDMLVPVRHYDDSTSNGHFARAVWDQQ